MIENMRPFEWGVALTVFGSVVQILVPCLIYITSLGSHVHAIETIGGFSTLPLEYKIMIAFTFVTLFSLPIAVEMEAHLWLSKGKRSWTAHLAFITYSIGLATVITWKINETLLISFRLSDIVRS